MSALLPLLFAMAGLFVGPVLYSVPHWRSWDRVLDSFAVAAVGGLCVVHLLPEAFEHGGAWALALAACGLVLPRLLHGLSGLGPGVLLAGLMVHAAVESTALQPGSSHDPVLGTAIVLHRLPVGLVVFGLIREHFRAVWMPWAAILALVGSTGAGYSIGTPLVSTLGPVVQAGLEALVAGMLLHVVWDHGIHGHGHVHPHLDDDPGHAPGHAHGAGHDHAHAHAHDHDHDHDHAHAHAHAHEHAHAHGPDHGHARGHAHAHDEASEGGAWVALAAVLGIAVVAAVVLRGHDHDGLSVMDIALELGFESAPALVLAYGLAGLLHAFTTPATARWLNASGQPGRPLDGRSFGLPLDALLISVPLLGPALAAARLVAAVAIAALLNRGRAGFGPQPEDAPRGTLSERLWAGLRFGAVERVDQTLPWIVVGVVVAALAVPLLGNPALTGLSPWVKLLGFALVGVPVYVSATGATPFASVALSQGVAPGATLAFLLTGPTTDLTGTRGRSAALVSAVVVTMAAVLAGLVTEAILPTATAVHEFGHAATTVQVAACMVLAVLAFGSLFRHGPRGMMGRITRPIHAH